MIGQFDFSQKGWVSGKGRSAVWREIPFDQKTIEPQYLMALQEYLESEKSVRGRKVALMNITSSTNARTVVAGYVRDFPCSHSLNPSRLMGNSILDELAFLALVNSFAYDYLVRMRLGGINLSEFILNESVLPCAIQSSIKRTLAIWAARLTLVHRAFAPEWLLLRNCLPELGSNPWASWWAVTASDRMVQRCVIDALAAYTFGLNEEDLSQILSLDASDPKGFWRVDQDLPVEQRQTTLALEAFRQLQEVGVGEFCQAGWELPDHARTFERPGVKSWRPVEDWPDCERHTRNILGDKDFARFKAGLHGQAQIQTADQPNGVAEPAATYGPGIVGGQRRLFPGDPPLFGDPMEDPPPPGGKRR